MWRENVSEEAERRRHVEEDTNDKKGARDWIMRLQADREAAEKEEELEDEQKSSKEHHRKSRTQENIGRQHRGAGQRSSIKNKEEDRAEGPPKWSHPRVSGSRRRGHVLVSEATGVVAKIMVDSD